SSSCNVYEFFDCPLAGLVGNLETASQMAAHGPLQGPCAGGIVTRSSCMTIRGNGRGVWQLAVLISAGALLPASTARGQGCLFRVPQVGGVSINAEGVLDLTGAAEIKDLREGFRK